MAVSLGKNRAGDNQDIIFDSFGYKFGGVATGGGDEGIKRSFRADKAERVF